MKNSILFKTILVSLLVFLFFAPSSGQEKRQDSPGGYHGELDFPISWKRYYSYAEWTRIMHDIQKQYSHLADIQSVGKSRMGRDQYVITIHAKDHGDHTTKPAMWVDGAIHGNEVNGITCSLYVMWYLLTRYDYDAYVHDLVNNSTFYILPGLNVDADNSFIANPSNNRRGTFRPKDNDRDGLYDEDQAEDIDGDGEISTMYIEDSKGDMKLSADKRRFVTVTDETYVGRRFRSVGPEGFDNDKDGRINEDDIGGTDANRNYPFSWKVNAGDPYPLSEPCVRNPYEFMLEHPNIMASFHFHNTGRLIMPVLPPTLPKSQQNQNQNQRRRRFSQAPPPPQNKYEKQFGEAFNIKVKKEYTEDLRAVREMSLMGLRILKNYTPSVLLLDNDASGNGDVTAYGMLGAYAYTIELWGLPSYDIDTNDDGRTDDEERMLWHDIELSREGWITPKKVEHPDLGEVWIGGTATKFIRRNTPASYMEQEAFKNAQFVLYYASQFPKVEIDDIELYTITDEIYCIDVTVKNDRQYPTFTDRSLQLGRAIKDKLLFKSSNNVEMLEISQGNTTLDPLNQATTVNTIGKKEFEFRLKGKQTSKYRYMVKMEEGSGWIEISVDSKNGGIAQKRINIKGK